MLENGRLAAFIATNNATTPRRRMCVFVWYDFIATSRAAKKFHCKYFTLTYHFVSVALLFWNFHFLFGFFSCFDFSATNTLAVRDCFQPDTVVSLRKRCKQMYFTHDLVFLYFWPRLLPSPLSSSSSLPSSSPIHFNDDSYGAILCSNVRITLHSPLAPPPIVNNLILFLFHCIIPNSILPLSSILICILFIVERRAEEKAGLRLLRNFSP